MVKVIALLKKKDGLTQEEFSRYWREKHGVLVAKTVPGLKRYVQNHVMKLPGGREPSIDGLAELWYDDMESWRKSAEWYLGDIGKIIRDDEDNFIDKSKMVFIVAEEDEVFKE
jgi:uncharacterized protein (TIGR02118 family)